MAVSYRAPRVSIEMHQEQISVDSMMGERVPDKGWKFVDGKGHLHAWVDRELPTLEWVVTGTEWFGDEYDATEVDVGEWRCRTCAVVVEPSYTTQYGERQFIPGLVEYTVTIDEETFRPSEQEYAESVAVWADVLRRGPA